MKVCIYRQSADSGRFADQPFSITINPDPVLPEVHCDHAARRHQVYILVGRALQSVLSNLYTTSLLETYFALLCKIALSLVQGGLDRPASSTRSCLSCPAIHCRTARL